MPNESEWVADSLKKENEMLKQIGTPTKYPSVPVGEPDELINF